MTIRQKKSWPINYPHSEFSVPVYFPQQPGVAVYHNRAIWPFVTAYNNNLGQLNTGITNAVKKLTVKDGDGKVVAEGILQMGNIGETQGFACQRW